MTNAMHYSKTRFSSIMEYETFQVFDKLLQKGQTLPEGCKVPTVKYFTGRNANLLTAVVVKYIQLIGGHAIRINSTGIPRKMKDGQTIWTKGASKGVADIQAVINGSPVMIEIKFGKDRQSEAQKKYQQSVEKAGGNYWLVRTFDDFLNKLSALE